MGLTHLKAYQRIKDVEIVAVAANDRKALTGDLSAAAGNLGGPGQTFDFSRARKFEDPFECVRADGIDAVDLCLPTALHAPVAIEALKHGKHVLVEKPMSLNLADCEAMISASKAAGRVLMTAQVLRFFPAYLPLIEGVQTGKFGRVVHAMFRRRCAAPAWAAWSADRSQSGGGVFDLVIHDVDMALACFGVPDAVSAWGYEDLQGGVDLLTAQLHYPGIESVTITGGWHHPKSYPFSMEYTVAGEKGTMDYSSEGRPTAWYDASGEKQAEPASDRDGYQSEIEYFLECCRENKAPAICPPESSAMAVKITQLAEAARRKKGEPIPCRS
jgi:predicted dehydrogenase